MSDLYERSLFHFHFLSHELNPDDVSHPNKGQDILVSVYKLETGMKNMSVCTVKCSEVRDLFGQFL